MRNVVECPGGGVNQRGFCYQKRTGEGRTLGVIVHTELGVNMILGRSGTGERGEDYAMGKGQSTDLERGEESRRIDGGRHRFLELNRRD